MKKILLYWHTLRFLKPIQIFGRIWFYFNRVKIRTAPSLKIRQSIGKWIEPIPKKSKLISSNVFFFLNLEGDLREVGWGGAGKDRLWKYNLHYFDYLLSEDSTEKVEWHRTLINDWILKNTAFKGVGWESYPTSLRIVNWIKWTKAGNDLEADWLQSLSFQAEWLSNRLEWHIRGNHLLSNAKALIFAGLFMEGKEPARWLRVGLEIMDRELDEQILPDGGHFERSTMYQCIVLEDLLDLINIMESYQLESEDFKRIYAKLFDKAKLMGNWLRAMIHPDGHIAYFNDSALNVAAAPASLFSYMDGLNYHDSRPEMCCRELESSGYFRLSNEKGSVTALLDVGPIGPDYLLGHAHADTLSFELSVHGQRVVVNGGTSTYEEGQQRILERGTSSHSTVEIDHLDSSEVWSSFRVAKRAMPLNKSRDLSSSSKFVSCSHDGYSTRLKGQPIHQRTWKFAEEQLLISDQIVSKSKHAAIARFIFHPEIQISQNKDDSSWALKKDARHLADIEILSGSGNIAKTTYALSFGKLVETSVLEVCFENGKTSSKIIWDQND